MADLEIPPPPPPAADPGDPPGPPRGPAPNPPRAPRLRRLARRLRRLAPGGAVVVAGVSATPLLIQGPERDTAVHHRIEGVPDHPEGPPGELTVMTLNLAHGRSDGFHQMLQSKRRIVGNLTRIARVIDRERPHVVALQEADGPSLWSGQFDHVRFVAAETGFAHYVRGEHVVAPRTRYGTAVISRLAVEDALSITFRPSPPTLSKGFVVATVALPGRPDVRVDVVSVHLDFARRAVRQRQVGELIRRLRDRPHPRVILGDFNAEWADERTLRILADNLDLIPWRPEAQGLATFPFSKKRLDWILASPRLEFVEHRVLDDAISDHRAVIAVLALREDGRREDGRREDGRREDGRREDGRREDGRREDGRREDGRREDGRREDGRRGRRTPGRAPGRPRGQGPCGVRAPCG